jgi:predicted secreted protein
MSSDRQIKANRQNAQRSTGPRTANGKARVSLNALKHGLTGRQVVLPNENPEDFDSFRANLLHILDPHDELEATFAEGFIIDEWRRRRVPLMEAALYNRAHQASVIAKQKREARRYESAMSSCKEASSSEMSRLMEVADALARLKESRSKPDPSVELTTVFETCADTFTHLSRYEVALSRSLLRNLHELQRLQAMRAGERVPPPAAVDVDVNINGNGVINPE